jgi:hypothetical protein
MDIHSVHPTHMKVLQHKQTNIKAIQPQINKIQRFNTWACMDLSIPKCALTGALNKSEMPLEIFKAYI